jgi:penicillin amidase
MACGRLREPRTCRPLEQGTIPGLTKSVEVVFDDRGVPHIYAATEEDAFRALGFVMARDRLFQMELQTRAAEGRLTEWIGPKVLDVDQRTRTLGLRWGAERKLAAANRNTIGYRAMNAYADGVNAWISSMRPRDLPMEYRLLGVTPGKWEPIYSLSFFSKMALTLAFNDGTYNRPERAGKGWPCGGGRPVSGEQSNSGAHSTERSARPAV